MATPLLMLMATVAAAGGPADAVAAAHADVLTVRDADARYVRYQTLYAMPSGKDGKQRETDKKVWQFVVNSLSRSGDLRKLNAPPSEGTRLVSPDLVRVDLRDFRWSPEVYDRLADADPYFHETVSKEDDAEKVVEEYWPGGRWTDGKDYPAGNYPRKVRVPGKATRVTASYLPREAMAGLVARTQSRCPIVRLDWFVVQVAFQQGRAAGYYDFLGLKKRQDFLDLIGFDAKLIKTRERELVTMLQRSGISENNRLVDRFGANDFGYWRTRDVFNSQTKAKNALNALNGDFQHDAEEHYGFLANGLFAYYLSAADGTQQNFAPPEVGFDRSTTSNRGRIDIFKTCVTCHVEGLRPLEAYNKRLFSGSNTLSAYDPEKFQRLRRLYLQPMDRWYTRDVKDFADTLAQLNGADWTPKKNATEYQRFFKAWGEDDVDPEAACRELDPLLTPKALIQAVKRYATPTDKGVGGQKGLGQLVPNTLLAYTHDDDKGNPAPLPLLREHFEEHYSLLQSIIRGLVPARPSAPKKGG